MPYEGFFRSRTDGEWCGSVGIHDTEELALAAARRQGDDCIVSAREVKRDPTESMSKAGAALFNCFKPSDPNEQIRSLRALAEAARIAKQNEDYADKFMGGHNAD